MTNNKLLSVIVPAYNTEKYIGRCLQSLCQQTFNPALYEVIVVDDNSPDNLGVVVCGLQNEYPQIRYIHQDNKKSGGARNTGIRASSGKYIIFVDADDYVHYENTLEILASTAEAHSLDILWSNGYLSAHHNSDYVSESYTQSLNIINTTGRDALLEPSFKYAVWQFVINREFLSRSNVKFREGVYFEDSDFTTKLFYYASSVGIIDFKYYVYCFNEESCTNTPKLKIFEDNCKSLVAINTFLNISVTDAKVQSRLRDNIKKSPILYPKITRSFSVDDSVATLSGIGNHDVMRLANYTCTKSELVLLLAMKYCPTITFSFIKYASQIVANFRNIVKSNGNQ